MAAKVGRSKPRNARTHASELALRRAGSELPRNHSARARAWRRNIGFEVRGLPHLAVRTSVRLVQAVIWITADGGG